MYRYTESKISFVQLFFVATNIEPLKTVMVS